MNFILNKILIITSLLLFIIQSNSHSQGFNSVFSKDGNEVWAVGISGNLFRSADAGSTWSSYTLGSVTLNSVFAINPKVWIVGNNGSLQLSNNNGLSWTPYTLSGQNLNSVFFTDANMGWIVGNSGTILKTVNGGVNWTPQTSPVATKLNSVRFTSSLNGVACGEGGKVLYTNNGGTNWLQYTTPTTKNLLSIDQKTNTIIASASDGIVIKSTNNGSSWSITDYKIVSKSDVNSVHMLDANTYYSCGGGGFIRKSTNGGATFTYQMNPMMANLVSIYFYDNNKGWAVSSKNNAVIRTLDGGNTWSLPANATVTLSWVLKRSGSSNIGNGFSLHPTNKNGIFVAMGSQVYRSLDIGENWTLIATLPNSPAHTFFVSPLDTNLMLASTGSSSGRVHRSTDYGQSWTLTWGPLPLTSYGMPLEIDQNNPSVAYLAPDNAMLLRSTNFGLNWLTAGNQIFRSPCDITVGFENSNLIYVGDGTTNTGSGELFKSTNGGINWTSIHTVSGSEIPMIAISSLDLTLSYHTTWSSGGFWKTSNQWNNFTQITTGGNLWATDISKDDPNAVVHGTYGSTIYISTNAGSTFTTTTASGSGIGAGALYYDKGNVLMQQGAGVYKLNITYNVPTVLSNNQISSEIPKDFSISQNYPNPFNPSTKISYGLPIKGFVKIIVYDVLGKEIQTLVNQELKAGGYEAVWDASGFPSGIYFYSLFSNSERIETKKMMLVK